MLNNKALLFITTNIVIFIIFVSTCHSAANLALNKHYTLSLKPNYANSALPSDTSALTDGNFTIGYFWAQKTTVGWQDAKTVEVIIDLETQSNIASIAFNTARGNHADVFFPAHIAAFVGPDKEHLQYVGDIAINAENQPGSYEVRKFKLNNIDARGRYVFLEVVPKGNYMFCDEIEVFEGSSSSGQRGTLTVEQARVFTDQMRKTGIVELLKNQVRTLDNTIIDGAQAEHIQQIKNQILFPKTMNDVDAVEAKMLEFRGAVLKARFPGKDLMIEAVNPWAQLNTHIYPVDKAPPGFSFMLPKGGYDSKALSITNLSVKSQEISVLLDKEPLTVELAIYLVPFVKTGASEYIADPLVPSEKRFILRPGETRIMFVMVHGTQPGTWNHTLLINRENRVTPIPITSLVTNVALPKALHLDSVNWSYLDFALIKDRKKEAAEDLYTHHTNAIVVPPQYLPIPESANDPYFIHFENYLKVHKGISKVLLFANFGQASRSTVNGKYPFMGNEWKRWFARWYSSLVLAAGRAGINENRIYLYPYDEMEGQQVEDFVCFATWVKETIPSIKLYATLGEATQKSKGWERIFPYLDIAQAFSDDMLKNRNTLKGQAWIYSANGISRSLPPYIYYRMASWKAFVRGYTGVGFWAYADIGENNSAWEVNNRDFAVIYEGKNDSIISSRRWEAWRMGIEDYELLTMYAKVKGERVAKDLAATVLNHPEDTSKADEVRRRILTELSGMEIN